MSRHFHAAHEAVGRVHGDGAHDAFTEVLRDLEHEVVLLAVDRGLVSVSALRMLRQLARRELDVDDGSDDLGDLAFGAGRARCRRHVRLSPARRRGLGALLRACYWVDNPGRVYHEPLSLPTHSRRAEKLAGSDGAPARAPASPRFR